MGDDLRAGEEAQKEKGVIDHRCEHPGCGEWAGWGYSRTRQQTHWFCYKHREDGDALLGR